MRLTTQTPVVRLLHWLDDVLGYPVSHVHRDVEVCGVQEGRYLFVRCRVCPWRGELK